MDVIIGIAFLISVLSGILLLFLPSGGGFNGGRNAGYTATVPGMDQVVN